MRLALALAVAATLVPPAGAAGGTGVTPRPGETIGTLVIPRLGLRLPLGEGVARQHLDRGPGHYPWTWLPGQGETVAIAGHRTTRGAPFRELPGLERGDAIYIVMRRRLGGRSFRYRVTGEAVLRPDEGLPLIRDRGYERLVLTTCHPPGSATRRYVVFALPSQT